MKKHRQDEQSLTRHLLAVLDRVLREECSQIDRLALGHWCGLNQPWWLPDADLPLEAYFMLLRQLHLNDVPNIALRVASRSQLSDLGVFGYAMLASPTLEQSLRLISHFGEAFQPYERIWLETNDDYGLLRCEILPEGREFHQLRVESWLIGTWRVIQGLLPEGLAACASYATMDFGAPTYHWQYQQILGCHVDFEKNQCCLAIPRQWLYIPVRNAGQQASILLNDQVRRILPQDSRSGDIVSRVKRMLLEHPNECAFQLEATAPFLSLSPRTLRRHLASAGTSFRRVCLEVRMELAKDYLTNTQLTVQEIAYQLGYSQPNNFYRAFKGYFEKTPEALRLERID
ncbi:helix-turn-helix domain-containing protein [Maricurvus nonylphenolicus]|uniref:helix-turn-helix transcriptional regulator n=1 Tax=Maricurvus nonylphenolicus TaxID=1008307 RepID=UPI0036F2BBEA